ncbi:FAD-binding oxidoreductase [Sphingomonas koreensis]|nr:FAD-binding oxidoreductase [Sphingomonas koreensis]RSU27162.1 FAD-binding oxidoreductase [Sphingomonas koreensis]RSU30307.1 FAD-binding oxidoreductase [Sphingomonas koreensis]RSU32985.1 FAD-binding oxidoreductase [Sphingomonas koreensis]RSU40846.1 FAD-binding oxidoreductase [Sphingomonas koreensis]
MVERMEATGKRVVRDHMPDQHREFYAQLPFMVVGSVDPAGDAWATFLEGEPGFMVSSSPTTLEIGAIPDPSDPATIGIQDGKPIGMLGIEMHTRRRNRMNGFVTLTAGGIHIDVDQSFGNCPRYIQLRDFSFTRDSAEPYTGPVETLGALDADARAVIAAADTFFVASYAEREDRRQVDVSHRGGKPGFIRIGEDDLLTIPDFDGNLFFNTLGNILLNGRAGLMFADFATGDMLQMTGDAEVILESPEIAAFQGAERLWTFRPRRIVRRRGALALRWAPRDEGTSPNSLMTGDWDQAADRLRASDLATRWRPYRVARIVDESALIRSFHLQPDDGAGKLPHAAGQHLPIRVGLPGFDRPAIRTYTLSAAPSDDAYRISVKRDGAVSRFLHDAVQVGDIIEARAPAGAFTIDAREKRPAVLLAAGVGITPMLAMLRHIVYEGVRKQRVRPTILFHAARSKLDRAFDREIAELVEASKGAVRVIRVLSDPQDAKEGADYEAAGRIEIPLLTRSLQFDDYDFYLCGPPAFTQSIYDGLRDLNIGDGRIHAETFGPSSLVRREDAGATVAQFDPPAAEPVKVIFTETAKEARWQPGAGSLLELAEARGLEPEFSCREGSCGTCKVKLLAGKVTYLKRPGAAVADDEVLICSAVPAPQDGDHGIQLAL